VVGLVTVFVASTDGRYFGKKLAYVIYNQLGPLIMASSRDKRKWNSLIKKLDLVGNRTILDVGTAMGGLPMAIASQPDFHGEAVGIDWSPKMIRVAQKRAKKSGLNDGVEFKEVDVRHGLPFGDGLFDFVFCIGLIETLSDPEFVVRELRRVLRDDGILVVSVYHGWSSWGYSLPYEWYLKNLASLGLDEVERMSYRKRHDIIVARSRPFIPALSRTPRASSPISPRVE
jgi:ubiquinone/menaquinone biosynthesis C-methylase UbiE